MSTDSRHHHYLPQCYLRGFTKGAGKDSKLKVFDLKRRKIFDSSTRNVGGIRDFNRVDMEGIPPCAVETSWSSFEGELATVLRELQPDQPLSGSEKGFILTMIAILTVRSPEMREHWRQFHAEIAKRIMDNGLFTKERWEKSAAAAGILPPPLGSTYEEMKAFHEEGKYKLKVPTIAHLAREMEMVDILLPLLADRNWLVLSAPDESSQFITSDHPAVLKWRNSADVPLYLRNNPGFGLPGTRLLVPLRRDLVVLGEYDGRDDAEQASRELVAAFNTQMIISAYSQLYAPSSAFPFFTPDKRITIGSHLFSVFPSQ